MIIPPSIEGILFFMTLFFFSILISQMIVNDPTIDSLGTDNIWTLLVLRAYHIDAPIPCFYIK